jgi:Sensors of blue-light using FAD
MSDATAQFLYLSRIDGPKPFEVFSAIVAESRPRNARDGITGLLLFDGVCVCQHIEGGTEAVEALVRRLYADPRHSALRMLHKGTLEGPRRFNSWRVGYVLPGDADDIASWSALQGEAAVQALIDRLPSFDLEP